jgi:hypothetical protein
MGLSHWEYTIRKRYTPQALARFYRFHTNNPHVFEEFESEALMLWNTYGLRKYGARTIFEHMRWDKTIETRKDVFKVNDDYVPIYARLLMYLHPKLKGFFELRGDDRQTQGHKSAEQRKREENHPDGPFP